VILFIDSKILGDDIRDYLKLLDVEQKEYNDLWAFLCRREWGEGKVKCSNRNDSFMRLTPVHQGPDIPSDILRDLSHAHTFPIHRGTLISG
jgi:hypothetical protein